MNKLLKKRSKVKVPKTIKPGNKVYKQIQVDIQIFEYLHLRKGNLTWDQFFESIQIYLPDSYVKS